jgi:predicted MFS family arabinose efflux permease
MANTGSFPVVIPAPATVRQATWNDRRDDARTTALALIGLFVLGSGAAAAGFHYESQGYGALTIVGGALLGFATALPAWLLFRLPRRVGRK